MKIVVDENVPQDLVSELAFRGCQASAFPDDWKGLKNGKLLARIRDSGLDCLITCDKNFRYQQNIRKWPIALVVLPSPFFRDLVPLIDAIVEAASSATSGGYIEVLTDGRLTSSSDSD